MRGGGHEHHGRAMVLRLLMREDGLSQRELAGLMRIQPPSLSEVLDKLGAEDLIKREQNPEDRRVSNIYLTDKARELVKETQEARTAMGEDLLKEFPEEEREHLVTLLEKLAKALAANAPEDEHGDCGDGECGGGHGRHGRHHRGHEDHRGCGMHGDRGGRGAKGDIRGGRPDHGDDRAGGGHHGRGRGGRGDMGGRGEHPEGQNHRSEDRSRRDPGVDEVL